MLAVRMARRLSTQILRPVSMLQRSANLLAAVALLLDGLTGPALARTVAERVVEALSEPVQLGETSVLVGASVGIALRDDDSTVDTLMREADVAMYWAKGKGKQRVERFDAGMQRARPIRWC